MKAPAGDRRARLRAMLADLKTPGALESVDGSLHQADSGAVTATEAIDVLLSAQIPLRNNRRLEAALLSLRLPAVETLDQFDFSFQPSIKREQIESLHEPGLPGASRECDPPGSARSGQDAFRNQPDDRSRRAGLQTSLLRHAGGPDRVADQGEGRGQPAAPAPGTHPSRLAGR